MDQLKKRITQKSALLPTDFPVIDYGNEPIKKPKVQTTIYWIPNIYTNKAGNATLIFYTNDIKNSLKTMVEVLPLKT